MVPTYFEILETLKLRIDFEVSIIFKWTESKTCSLNPIWPKPKRFSFFGFFNMERLKENIQFHCIYRGEFRVSQVTRDDKTFFT